MTAFEEDILFNDSGLLDILEYMPDNYEPVDVSNSITI
jgi:hypothetical protein